jgi:retron-type reverse transcriptase
MKPVRLIKKCLNEMYSKVRIGAYLSESVPIQGFLSPLLSNFALEYDIRKVYEHQVGLKLNGTHQLLVYADDVILLRDDINTIK